MLQSNSRIELIDGIHFYEQDILYDDYIYTGSCQVELDIDYYNNGFGLVFIKATNNVLTDKSPALLFRLNHKSLEVIYKENALQKNLGTYSAAYSVTCTDNLKILVKKNDNVYTVKIGEQIVCKFVCTYDFTDYFLGYYSNKDNTINNISIASTIPYGWIVNMQQTNGGYIDFYRDGFKLRSCKGLAEIEQIEIPLKRGFYYLNYTIGEETDIKPYVFLYNDESDVDYEKNILQTNGKFMVPYDTKVSVKFKGTRGSVSKIAVTTSKDNEYVRTSPDYENIRIIEGSQFLLNMSLISKFEFSACIKSTPPGGIHVNPIDYHIIKDSNRSYGIDDFDLVENVYYYFTYENNDLNITNKQNPSFGRYARLEGDLSIFNNVNAVITDFVITDYRGKTTNITIENTIKQYVPAVIKSPIVALDEDELPLDLSSSYRYYYKNNKKYYWFTNTEREYFKPAYTIKLEDKPLNVNGSVIVYGVKKNSKFELDRLLEIEKEGFDSLNACADSYDIIFEENLRYINKEIGEIRLHNIDDYSYIVVDYLKENSYCLNYRYDLHSYEVDISVIPGKEVSLKYDNVGSSDDSYRFINEYRYVKVTDKEPSCNGYIVIGGGKV